MKSSYWRRIRPRHKNKIIYDQIANFLGAKLNPSYKQTALFTDLYGDVLSDSSENKKLKLVPMEVNFSQIQGKKRLIYYDFFESMFGNMIIDLPVKAFLVMFY